MTASPHAPRDPGFPAWLVDAALQAALAVPGTPAVFGISGVQGSGKSTFARQLAAQARRRRLHVAVLSLDDFYLPAMRRRDLATKVHPLLATRGPPGTHDLPLALEVLDHLHAGHPARLPRFDKLADDRVPGRDWPRVETPVDLVLLEGWMLGVPAQPPSALLEPVNALERTQDPDATWRTWCNHALEADYPALWRRMDTLWMLKPPSFDVVPAWRWQQEQSLLAASPLRTGMTRAQVDRFVQLFERVSRHALEVLPGLAQHVVELDERRDPRRGADMQPAP